MSSNFPTFKLSDHEAGGSVAHHGRQPPWWRGLPVGMRSPVWPAILATVTVLGMLLAFHQVVLGAVQQSELRRKAIAQHAEATWRCNALRGPHASDSCLLLLNATARGDALLQARNIPKGASIE